MLKDYCFEILEEYHAKDCDQLFQVFVYTGKLTILSALFYGINHILSSIDTKVFLLLYACQK